jgi:hypothetical protein
LRSMHWRLKNCGQRIYGMNRQCVGDYCCWNLVLWTKKRSNSYGSHCSVEMGSGETNGAGRYIKGVTLGEGTFGVVFKAIDRVVIMLTLEAWIWFTM